MKPLLDLCESDNISFYVAPYEKDIISFFSKIAENCIVNTNHNYMIFDWIGCIALYMSIKSSYDILADGILILSIDNRKIKIQVSDKKVSVGETDQTADMVLNSLDAIGFLFSLRGNYIRNETITRIDPQKRFCIQTWFPLPLFIPAADCC